MYAYIYIYIFILDIHIIVYTSVYRCRRRRADPQGAPGGGEREDQRLVLRGNHLSNTTCLTQVFFKSGEYA